MLRVDQRHVPFLCCVGCGAAAHNAAKHRAQAEHPVHARLALFAGVTAAGVQALSNPCVRACSAKVVYTVVSSALDCCAASCGLGVRQQLRAWQFIRLT